MLVSIPGLSRSGRRGGLAVGFGPWALFRKQNREGRSNRQRQVRGRSGKGKLAGAEGEVAINLVAPGAPAGCALPREQFGARYVSGDPDDALPHLVGLAGMLAPGRHDQAGNAGADPLGLPPSRQQARLGVGMGPVTPTRQEAGVQGRALDLGEGHGFVGEAPGADDGQGVGQVRRHRPQE